MHATDTREVDAPLPWTGRNDNSGLRARLGDQVVEHRAIVAELRAAMAERTGEDLLIDLHEDAIEG